MMNSHHSWSSIPKIPIKMQRIRFSSFSKTSLPKTDDEDRISNLPEPILHHILSFLPTKDATKTCILSKTWNSTWNSFPILQFDYLEFRNAISSRKDSKPDFKKAVQEFCNYIHNTINRRRESTETSIREFKINVQFLGRVLKDHSPDIDSWLDYAVTNNVQNFVLCCRRTHQENVEETRYLIPSSLFRATSLKQLDLHGCRFMDEYSTAGIGFSLKTLKLSQVYMPQKTFQSLVSDCQHIENFTIKHCNGFEVVRIDNSPKLKTVDLFLNRYEPDQHAAIDAPNLKSLIYAGDLPNVLRSIKASNHKNIRELRLFNLNLTDELFRAVTTEFKMLKKLELIRCNCKLLDNGLCISSDQLLELCLCDCFHLKEILLDTKALKRFKGGESDRQVPVDLRNVSDGLRFELVTWDLKTIQIWKLLL